MSDPAKRKLFASIVRQFSVFAQQELRPSRQPWAVLPAARALLAGGVIAAIAWFWAGAAAGGVAYFGAACAITLSVLGPPRARLTNSVAQAVGAALGLSIAGLTPHAPFADVIAATAVAFASGFVGRFGSAWTALALMTVIGVAYGQFAPTPLDWTQQVVWYLVGSFVVAVIVAIPLRAHEGATARIPPAGTSPRASVRVSLLNGVRLALAMGVATVFGATLDRGNHSFWLPLTVAVVMRVEYGAVLFRAVNRVVGTIVGALIAALIIILFPSDGALAAFAILGIAFAALAAPKLYALSVIGITASALMSTEIGATDPVTPLVRVGDTLLGALIAIVLGHLIWVRAARRPSTVGS
ncbi:MAG TPA: FUSC family protein [Galbitalea sp.]